MSKEAEPTTSVFDISDLEWMEAEIVAILERLRAMHEHIRAMLAARGIERPALPADGEVR
jgi:hypothetical protein